MAYNFGLYSYLFYGSALFCHVKNITSHILILQLYLQDVILIFIMVCIRCSMEVTRTSPYTKMLAHIHILAIVGLFRTISYI